MTNNIFAIRPLGKPIGRRIRFHHSYKPWRRPLVRVFRVEIVRGAA
jgi:hypothetical protein